MQHTLFSTTAVPSSPFVGTSLKSVLETLLSVVTWNDYHSCWYVLHSFLDASNYVKKTLQYNLARMKVTAYWR